MIEFSIKTRLAFLFSVFFKSHRITFISVLNQPKEISIYSTYSTPNCSLINFISFLKQISKLFTYHLGNF